MKRQINRQNNLLTPKERWAKFIAIQSNAFKYMSPAGYKNFTRRNMKKRAISYDT